MAQIFRVERTKNFTVMSNHHFKNKNLTLKAKGLLSLMLSFLHFSVPDEGPLTDYEKWMPDFVGGLAKGIEKSRGMIEKAMNGVAADMTVTPRVMAAQDGYGGGSAGDGDLLSGIHTALNAALAGGGAAGDIVIPVYIGGDMIDEVVVTAQQRMNLRSGGR